jgi:translation initiation factor 2 beta subunit (eIF-2beta)/eIF-5
MAQENNFELMLTQLYQQLDGDDDNEIAISKKIPHPKINSAARKIHWENYYPTVKAMNRDFTHFQIYIQNELGINTSLKNVMNIKEGLIMHTKCRDKQLKSLLGKYYTSYVICKSCGSDDTEMEKLKDIAKLYQIKCNSCLSTFNVV